MSEHLAQALGRHNSDTVRELLENEFEKVAQDNYEWLNELVDVGYSWDDIAELLLEEANDAPWIYCDPRDQPAQDTQHPAATSNDPANLAAVSRAQSHEEQSLPPQQQTVPQLERCKGCGEPWRRPLPGEEQYRQSSPMRNMGEQLALTQDLIKQLENHAKFADEAYLTWKRKHQWCQQPTSPPDAEPAIELRNKSEGHSPAEPLAPQTHPAKRKSEVPHEPPRYRKVTNFEPTFEPSKYRRVTNYQPTFLGSPWMSKRHDIKKMVQQLCGLGGIAPISRSLKDWNGKVFFEANFSTSYITYSITSKDDRLLIVPRLRQVLEGFCEAAEVLKGAGLCQDHFTIAQIPAVSNASTCNVELKRVDIAWAFALLTKLDGLSNTIHSDIDDLVELLDTATKILQPLIVGDDPSVRDVPILKPNSTEDILHACCLAAQFLCVGLVAFCQGHIGPIESIFTNHSQQRSLLLGSSTFDGHLGTLYYPCIAVRLTKLTCLSAMTEGPLITFSLVTEGSEEDKELQEIAQKAFLVKDTTIPRLSLHGVFANESEHNVKATPEDILYTWGPGKLVLEENEEDEKESREQNWVRFIEVGGGVIYYQYEFGRRLHWEAGSVPKEFPGRSFHYQKKVIVGAPVTENLTQCSFDWKKCRSLCHLVHLAVRSEAWTVNERQVGLQFGPDHVALQAIQVWNKVPAKLLKEYQLQQGDFGFMEFLGCYVGVQVSCCTGVARRVSLQELLSDLIPKFSSTHMGKFYWHDWNTKYDIVSGLCRDDVREWLTTLRHSSPTDYTILLTYLNRILNILEPTGLNRERTHIKIAWPTEGDLHRGIKVSCLDKHLWAQVLADSEESITFAYMTTTCLLCEGNPCQQLRKSWPVAPKCLGTAVTQYRNEVGDDAASTTGPWTIQNGQSYHMWNEKRCIRMRADASPPSSQQYRLTASESAIPSHIVKRHFRSRRSKKNLLRERHHPEDAAVDVLIVDKE